MDIRTLTVRLGRLLCMGVMAAGGVASATDYYVAPWGDDGNDGLSWETAMRSPELVPDKWSGGGHTLTISNGTYKLTKTIVGGEGAPNIKIGSLTGKPEDVILDGQGRCGGIRLWNGYNGAVTGLTVTNCVVKDMEGGAGIATRDTWCKITDCIVRDCHIQVEKAGNVNGAGIHAMWSTIAGCTVENCTITNVAGAAGKSVHGAGIFAYRTMVTNCAVRGCAIRLNAGECYPDGAGISAQDGGEAYASNIPLPGVYDTEITGCEISMPYAWGGCGAGLYITCQSPDGAAGEQYQATVRNCLISSCTNWYYGPLSAAQHTDIVNTTITNCVDVYPSPNEKRGTGLYMYGERIHARGCLIAGNVGTQGDHYSGGTPAVVLDRGCSLVDCAVIGNSGGSRVGLRLGSNALVSNCLFRANVQTKTCACGLVYVPDLDEGSVTEVVDSSFVENDSSTGNWGGWVWFLNGADDRSYDVRFRNCLCANNKFGGGGAVIYSSTKKSKMNAIFENCTLVNNENNGGYHLMHGYYETDASGALKHVSPYRMKVRGCVIVGTTGTGGKGIEKQIYVVTNNVNYSVFPFVNALNQPHPDSVGNKEYDASKPLFVDAEAKDYRMAQGSQALDMVPASAWMGTGRKKGPQDLGSGCEMVAVEDHGVTIRRLNASRRLSGDCADAGCTELYRPLGMSVLLR